jgi:hypothetical protein
MRPAAAKARPVSTPAGTQATAQAECTAPNAAMIARKISMFIVSRIVVNIT